MNHRPQAAMFYHARWLNSPQIELYSWAAKGFIVHLMCKAWGDDDCSLPDNEALFAKWFGVSVAEWKESEVRASVLEFFPISGPGRRANEKQRELYSHDMDAVEKASLRGRNAAAKRWESKAECTSNADAMPTHTASNADPMQSDAKDRQKERPKDRQTEGQKDPSPIAPKGASEPEGFGSFWDAYPLKAKKPKALSAFKAALAKADLPTILAGLARWKASWDWTKDGGKYRPLPASWLNAEQWNDSPRETHPPTGANVAPIGPNKPREEQTKEDWLLP